MQLDRLPEMAVIVVTPDRYETIRKTMRHLRAQTVKERLEIVIVAPSGEKLDLVESEMEGFLQFRVVEFGSVRSSAVARAAGIREARAPVVVLTEDHSYPDPHWAEALLKAHQHSWAAVGPAVENANPGSTISWANLLIEYSEWLAPAPAGVVNYLPGHNSSYKRTILLDYGQALDALLESEVVLHWDLQRKGYQLFLEPAAKTSHLNFSDPFAWLPLRFLCGRLFAQIRRESERWSLPRRLLFIGGSPLIPFVRLWRILRVLRTPGRSHHLLPRVLPALLVGLILDAIGELFGYTFSKQDVSEKLFDLDFHRHRFLRKKDQDEIYPE